MKLVKANGFNRPPQYVIHTTQPASTVLAHLAVLLLKNGTVEVQGHIKQLELAHKMLEAAHQRLDQWHAQQQAQRDARIVGLDGLPLTKEDA